MCRVWFTSDDFRAVQFIPTALIFKKPNFSSLRFSLFHASSNMAYTSRAEADCKEFFDDPESLNLKIKKLAELIRKSKHFCAFTGAGSFIKTQNPSWPNSHLIPTNDWLPHEHKGISTAAGIADFRSGINNVLDTGTGQWAAMSAKEQGKSKQIKKGKRNTSSMKAIPTASHMALVSLATTGPKYLKCLISQNTDGLHRRSGIPVDKLCELHGNTLSDCIFTFWDNSHFVFWLCTLRTLEVCDQCGRGYMRDYWVGGSRKGRSVHDHKTGTIYSFYTDYPLYSG